MNKRAILKTKSTQGELYSSSCRVIGETPKHYRIVVDKPTPVPPGFSILMPEVERLVPKHAVEIQGDFVGGKWPPKELWVCRDWFNREPTYLKRSELEESECADCVDGHTCKGPVHYLISETD